MRTDTPNDMPTHLFDDPEAFITKSGKFLRKTSLDELPQIEIKAKLDGEYVKNMGPIMDTKCFLGTVVSVVKSDGVVEGGKKSSQIEQRVVSNRENYS